VSDSDQIRGSAERGVKGGGPPCPPNLQEHKGRKNRTKHCEERTSKKDSNEKKKNESPPPAGRNPIFINWKRHAKGGPTRERQVFSKTRGPPPRKASGTKKWGFFKRGHPVV